MGVPDPGPPPRPRSVPPAVLEPSAEAELIEAVEALHRGARRLGLPPQALTIGDAADAIRLTPQQETVVAAMDRKLAGMEAASHGPYPVPLDRVKPPTDADAWLVDGLIRPGKTVMLSGPPGSAKSWVTRQLALLAAAGRAAFLERYGLAKPMKVLVVDEDNGPDEEWRREQALLAALDLTRDDVANVHRTSLEGCLLDKDAWQHWLAGLIDLEGYDLVVLDPISEMHTGKELREDPSFRAMLSFLKRLKVDFPRTSTVVVHHTRKPAQGNGHARSVDDVRGQWGQTPDVVALMYGMAEHRSTWEVHKRVPHSKLLLEQLESGLLHVVADETTQRNKAIENDDAVLEAIRDGFTTHTDISRMAGMPKGTVTGVLNRLLGAGLIAKDGRQYREVAD